MKPFKMGFEWPTSEPAQIPWLTDRPPIDYNSVLELEDRSWRNNLVKSYFNGNLTLPGNDDPDQDEIKFAIYTVTFRLYHIARVVQTYFHNPNFGNYSDPFLESLFIHLTWRSRIEDARSIMNQLRDAFAYPGEMLEPDSLKIVREIVGRAGFSGKRPEMLVDLVRKFIEQFPNGDFDSMVDWEDAEVLEFLTDINGIGPKSALCVLMYSLNRSRFPIDTHVRRVLRKTELLVELFVDPDKMNHREFQKNSEEFVPPSVRQPLHAGLLAVGQEFCLSSKPRCGKCPIRYSCEYFRSKKVDEVGKNPMTHVELFAGAGGFGEGFTGAGFRTLLAIDNDRSATTTYRLNHPSVPMGNIITGDLNDLRVEDIRELMECWREDLVRRKPQVLTAGIPCQGFSKAGYRARPGRDYDVIDDPRNQLYEVVIDWTGELQPAYVVIENVPALKSAGNGEKTILHEVRKAFEGINYKAAYATVNAYNFGVPQTRNRFILIASHKDVSYISSEDLIGMGEGEKILLWDAISHYPAIQADTGTWYSLSGDQVLTGHLARFNNEFDLKIFDAIYPGEHYRQFNRRRADILEDRRKNSDLKLYDTSSFGDKYHKLVKDGPSRTIVAHLKKDGNGYIHPEQVRSISPREAARIQGFDDDYVFTGSRSAQFVQIGNAVPPPLSKAIARLVLEKLEMGAE